ncbi:CCR4-NOT transcription complex subunit 4 isoform 1-T3 [Cochliomyia hominivorax]
MNTLNNSTDDVVECPLCMEPLEVDDLNFFPCTCGYQICRFCWHRIRTDENELCPACRKEYPENPADFKPLTQEEMIAFKSQKRQRDQQRKQKITENRKRLANVRVVQKNLVFVVGLPPRLADADILKKHEYFGKYGKIHKVVINPSTAYAGVQGPSASAYVTYVHNTDALRAIQSVNNIMIDGRLIKTSLGTTKYCSHFMKNQQCPKADCMYLHELGDPEASFTKEEMHQGKHQEYEKRLHDFLISSAGTSASGVTAGSSCSLNNNKNAESSKLPSLNSNYVQSNNTTCTTSVTTSVVCSGIQKEAWPSLSISPVNQNESTQNNKNRKERSKQDKNKHEKSNKTKNNKNNTINTTSNVSTKDSEIVEIIKTSATNSSMVRKIFKNKEEKSKERNLPSKENRFKKDLSKLTIAEHEVKDACKDLTNTFPNLDNNVEVPCSKSSIDNNITKVDNHRSLSASSNSSSSCIITSENNSVINESASGKSSPSSFNENNFTDADTKAQKNYKRSLTPISVLESCSDSNTDNNNISDNLFGLVENLLIDNKNTVHRTSKHNFNNNGGNNNDAADNSRIENTNYNASQLKRTEEMESITDNVSKLNLFDENSFFSKGILQQPAMSLKHKCSDEIIPNRLNSGIVQNLPDLINGIDGYQNNANVFQSSTNNYVTGGDSNRQSSYPQYEQQSNMSSNDNGLQKSLFGTNMSKFFDFHKQQQKLQQHCLQINSTSNMNDKLLMMPIIDNNQLNSQLVDQNCLLTSQNHQKQKIYGKIDQMLNHQSVQQIANPQIGPLTTQQNQFIHSANGDDELGFDPFIETQKALAELIENEEEQNSVLISSKESNNKAPNNQQHLQQHYMMEYMQRARMPPPGFNHVTNFNGYGVVPRVQNSKTMPFLNVSNNFAVPSNQHIQHQQQLQIPRNAWGTHLGNFQHMNEPVRQINSNQIQSSTGQNGYTGNDWTAMDPAILSFRQFSFTNQTQLTPQMPSQQQELFLQQLAQQNGIASQSQHLKGANVGVHNTILNSHQTSQQHVNANVQGMLEYLKTRQFV